MEELKKEFIEKYNSLPEARRSAIQEYYSTSNDKSTIREIFEEIKLRARQVKNYADRKGYGYGEVGYNLNEEVKDFAEEVPELTRVYSNILHHYFNHITQGDIL